MKHILITGITSAAVLLGAAGLAVPARAAAPVIPAAAVTAAKPTPGCVTKSEYKKAKKGMTKKKVAKIFGTNGRREAKAESDGYVIELRSYRTCSRYSAVAISFEKEPGGSLRLSAKSAVWVS